MSQRGHVDMTVVETQDSPWTGWKAGVAGSDPTVRNLEMTTVRDGR
jgi:hypothetical protein